MNQEPQNLLPDIDFCVSTFENKEGLERLLHSIVDTFKGACIFIADSANQLDRAYYKGLRQELGEAGMLNRMIVHHVGYKKGIAGSRNFLMNNTPNKYKVFLTDTDEVDEDTDIQGMAEILEKHKTIGAVSGSVVKNGRTVTPSHDDVKNTINGKEFAMASEVGKFVMVLRELRDSIRYNEGAADPLATFSNQMSKVPYQVAVLPSSKISEQNENIQEPNVPENKEGETSNGDGGGSTTERTVPPADGGRDGGESVPSRENETVPNPTNSRRQSRRGA